MMIVALGVALAPLLRPEIEDVVEVDVGQERRDHRALPRANLTRPNLPVFHHPDRQPFADQADDPPVADPVLHKANRLRPSGLPDANRHAHDRAARREISRFPRKELRRMLGSTTTQGRLATRLTCRAVLPSAHATAVAPWIIELSRLNTQPAPAPVNASTHASSRTRMTRGRCGCRVEVPVYPTPPPQIPACGFPAPGSRRRSIAIVGSDAGSLLQ